MKRVAFMLACIALASCGARPSEPTTRPRVVEETAESEVSGVAVIARERGGSGHLAAALSIRVRTDAPVLATAAALVVEARSEGRLTARATADGITLRTIAASDALDDVTRSLATALAARDASPEEVTRALERIRARRAGRADDDHARAARLAVSAMFGTELDALGSASDDATITSTAVSELLQSSFGVERALVAVVGDASASSVEASVARAFANSPHVTRDEAPPARLVRDAHAEISEHDVVAVARRVPDLRAAERAADWLGWADPSAIVSTFPLHGAAILVAVRDGSIDDVSLLAARAERATSLEGRWASRLAPDVEGELGAVVDAWLSRGAAADGDGVGIGVVAAGGDRAPDEDETRAAALVERARAALARTVETDTTTVDGADAERTLASGTRIRARHVGGGSLAVAIAFDGGAVLDPRTEHGRAALFAAILGRSCEPDADATWVDAGSIGLVVAGDPSTLDQTVARAVDCARRALRDAARADGVRAETIARLDDDARARAWAANVLAPATPGLVAPDGSAPGIAAASGLDVGLRAALAPDRATLVVLGDVEPTRAIAVASTLASELGAARTSTPEVRIGASATSDAFLADPVAVAPVVILTLRSDDGESAAAARATARTVARAMTEEGAQVEFWLGDAALGSSFIAVGVRGDDALLDAMPARMASRLATLDATEGLDEAIEADTRRRALASPLEVARAMATGDAPSSDPRAVVRALLTATPRYVMLRPSPGPLHPPRRR